MVSTPTATPTAVAMRNVLKPTQTNMHEISSRRAAMLDGFRKHSDMLSSKLRTYTTKKSAVSIKRPSSLTQAQSPGTSHPPAWARSHLRDAHGDKHNVRKLTIHRRLDQHAGEQCKAYSLLRVDADRKKEKCGTHLNDERRQQKELRIELSRRSICHHMFELSVPQVVNPKRVLQESESQQCSGSLYQVPLGGL
eukprot:CAMPEP_0113274710 /NCGR_PEP_ID=MMETSP0008_2-20120614/24551_1 /TAXON_ID=97485 /ORGANISM="Prymnesium parvum" /LENGTH=193 /DNA_ID=CAMNT_0000124355 /DNA_START=244 /DNA_END=821 /DNA_ORIENTATION=- /assembly_acc=CAM_ASM_000153